MISRVNSVKKISRQSGCGWISVMGYIFTSSVPVVHWGHVGSSIRVLVPSVSMIPVIETILRWCHCCIVLHFKSMTSPIMKHLPAAATLPPLQSDTNTEKNDVSRSTVWMFLGPPEPVRVPGPCPPHRQRLHQLRMDGQAVTPRAAFITRQRGNVDRNQRSSTCDRMSHSAALTSPVSWSGFVL